MKGSYRNRGAGLLVLATAGITAAAPHENYIHVGVTNEGVLAVHIPMDHPQALPLSIHPELHGWLGTSPAFEAPVRPDGDLNPIEEGADIHLELISIQPALRLYDHDLEEVSVGAHLHLGGAGFETHGVYHIDSDDPAYHFEQGIWEMEYRLVDMGTTGYGASQVYMQQFTTGCALDQHLSAVCKMRRDGSYQIVAKVKRGSPMAELTLRLDGDPNSDTLLMLDEGGKGKVKFPNVTVDHHHVEVVECGDMAHADCM